MREILFRGKTQQYTRWIYGDLNHYMCDDGVFIAENGYSMHRVFKETVGQFIGLTDKNGKKIFEGDIVLYVRDEELGQISYRESEAMFVIEFDTWLTDFDHLYGKDLEVIGNIHDNPELLKGGVE